MQRYILMLSVWLLCSVSTGQAFLANLLNKGAATLNTASVQSDQHASTGMGLLQTGLQGFMQVEQTKQQLMQKGLDIKEMPRTKAKKRVAAKKIYMKKKASLLKGYQAFFAACEQSLTGVVVKKEEKAPSAFDDEEKETKKEQSSPGNDIKRQRARVMGLNKRLAQAERAVMQLLDNAETGVGTQAPKQKLSLPKDTSTAGQWPALIGQYKQAIVQNQKVVIGLGQKFIESMPKVDLSPRVPIAQVMLTPGLAKPVTAPEEVTLYDNAKLQLRAARTQLARLVSRILSARAYATKVMGNLDAAQKGFFAIMDEAFSVQKAPEPEPVKEEPKKEEAPSTFDAFNDDADSEEVKEEAVVEPAPAPEKPVSVWKSFIGKRKLLHSATKKVIAFLAKALGGTASLKEVKVANQSIDQALWAQTYRQHRDAIISQASLAQQLYQKFIGSLNSPEPAEEQSAQAAEDDLGDEFGDADFGDEESADESSENAGSLVGPDLSDPVAACDEISVAWWTNHKRLMFLCTRARNAHLKAERKAKKAAKKQVAIAAAAPVVESGQAPAVEEPAAKEPVVETSGVGQAPEEAEEE